MGSIGDSEVRQFSGGNATMLFRSCSVRGGVAGAVHPCTNGNPHVKLFSALPFSGRSLTQRQSEAIPWGLMLTFVLCALGNSLAAQEWRAGVARAIITPEQPMWMAGYGGRTAPAEGKYHDLWIRVLAIDAGNGQRGVILSSDTLGISQLIYEDVVAQSQKRWGLERSQIMLHASHTHCGPVLKQALYDIYPLDDKQLQLVESYSAKLVETILATMDRALSNMQPARLSYGIGTTDFAVNRRTNREADVPALRRDNQLLGPVDHTVPVLSVRDADNKLLAIVFGYACHNTTLSFQQWCGDYAGFAQYALEERHPEATALFTMGCGADQNPIPRRTVELAQGYGEQLAAAVDAALNAEQKTITPQLRTALELTNLKFGPLPDKSRLNAMASANVSYTQRWAARWLDRLADPDSIPTEYPYPVQAWRLGENLLWISLGGEVVVDYSLKLKGLYGWDTWVSGYVNDVMAYIPSERVLQEGGYEGQSSMFVYGQPCERWAPGVEQRITSAVESVVREVTPR